MGAGGAAYRAGGWLASKSSLMSTLGNGLKIASKVAQPLIAAQQVAGVANGVAKGANAFMQGNYAQAFQEFGTTALNGIGLTSSLKQSWKAIKAIGTGNFKYFVSCFLPETPIYLTRTASKPIGEMKSYEEYGDDSDWVITRDESDPAAPLQRRRVLRKFVRVAPILNLHVAGRIIGTTNEHPFRVADKGWRIGSELEIGDVLLDLDGPNKMVDGVAYSGEVKTVVNIEVEGCHTYFVGDPSWGFAVWAHNAGIDYLQATDPRKRRGYDPGDTHLDHPVAEVFGGTTTRPAPAGMNLRKGGLEGELRASNRMSL